jgi:hypothetical protein
VAQFNKNSQNFLPSNKSLFETNILANPNGLVVDSTNPLEVGTRFSDTGNLTAFGRLRVANTRLLGEFRNMYGTYGPVEIITKFENGGSQTINLAQTNTLINTTTVSGSRALRQSRRYHPYVPGSTTLAFISFTFGAPKENLRQQAGLFDDSNGIFLRLDGETVSFVIRKGGTDSQVVNQEDWNVDSFDGLGISKQTLDITKSQVLVIDYQWLSIGRVRIGFDINGQIFYGHYFEHANSITEPYMFQPSLPVRWEIVNVGETTSNSSLMCISFGVYTEGQDGETGFDQSISSGQTPITVSTSQIGLLAIRLKNNVNSQPMRAFARLKEWGVFTDTPIRYRVLLLNDSSVINGSPSWSSASPTSWVEYTTNFTLTSFEPTNTVKIFDGFGSSGANKTLNVNSSGLENRLAAVHQNYDSTDSQILAIVAVRLTNQDASAHASMQWIEVK